MSFNVKGLCCSAALPSSFSAHQSACQPDARSDDGVYGGGAMSEPLAWIVSLTRWQQPSARVDFHVLLHGCELIGIDVLLHPQRRNLLQDSFRVQLIW
jgi:hypothetical protein